MVSLLGLGFLVGMRHAIEADHAAAVATLATKNHSVANTLKQGLTWGLGHTITLLLFGSMVFLLEAAVPEQLANWLELGVGVMLIYTTGLSLLSEPFCPFHESPRLMSSLLPKLSSHFSILLHTSIRLRPVRNTFFNILTCNTVEN